MHLPGYRSIAVIVCILAALASAQVTFSRDWSGGKRSPPVVFDCDQFARLCRHFLHELKQGLSDDKVQKHRRMNPEEIAMTYEDE